MKYEMEQLLPVVAKLSEKYTGMDSTSISYEKAEQLMGAVLYCIRQADRENEFSSDAEGVSGSASTGDGEYGLTPIREQEVSLQQRYDRGYELVEEKIKNTLDLYHNILQQFDDYGNVCLHDTVIKGMPEFFKWYDARFMPQNHILTLDYPVLKDLLSYTGIDKIQQYLCCIDIEQRFLHELPREYVISVLDQFPYDYRKMIENVCEIVLQDLITNMLGGEVSVKKSIRKLVEKYYDGAEERITYLNKAVDDALVRIKLQEEHSKNANDL